MIVKFYIEDSLIDLYEDNSIELNNSIANTNDITKISTSYTKTFTAPASDRNNAIFKHYYDADIDNTFDARTKKDASFSLDGLTYKRGRCRLEKVSVKNGAPSSYSVTFWGNLVNLNDAIGDDYLSDLDFSALNHAYNSDEVKSRLLTQGDIIYNLIVNKRQYFYNSDPLDDTNEEQLVNIFYNGNDRGVLWSELKPSIRLYAIIEAIEVKYGFTFSRDLFDREDFYNLYMLCVSDSTEISSSRQIDFTGSDTNVFTVTTYNQVTDENPTNYNSGTATLRLYPTEDFEDSEYTIVLFNGDTEILRKTSTGDSNTSYDIASIDYKTWNLSYNIESVDPIAYTATLDLYLTATSPYYEAPLQVITGDVSIARNIPIMTISDFLDGIFKAFKMAVIPSDDGTIYANTLQDYYAEGKIVDLTKYVDSNNYDVSRGTLASTLDFSFLEPTTLLNMQFETNTTVAYGDEALTLYDITDDSGQPTNDSTVLDGDDIEIELPFENLLFSRLTDTYTNTDTFIQYGVLMDEDLEPNTPDPIIFYNVFNSLGGNQISFINSDGVAEVIAGSINTPSTTLGLEKPNYSLLWGQEFSSWNGELITNTLYSNYWQKYIQDIFNIKKRNFSYTGNLPSWILNDIELNDIIKIGYKFYRLNDYTVNLITGTTQLNLINNFDTNFNLFEPSQSQIFTTYQEQLLSVYVSNSQNVDMVFTYQSLGYGVGWVTATQSNSFINIDIDANESGSTRDVFINVSNGSGKSFQIYVNQKSLVSTSDSSTITSDNNTITSDNG